MAVDAGAGRWLVGRTDPDGGRAVRLDPAGHLLHRLMLHRVEPFRGWHLQHHLHPDMPMRTPGMFSLMLIVPVAGLPILLHTHRGPAAASSFDLQVGILSRRCCEFGSMRASTI
jgi:hypothetical protein